MTGIDTRLTNERGPVTGELLVDLWTDHTPKHDFGKTCPTCGHAYTRRAPLCLTAAIVRPLLQRRVREFGAGIDPMAMSGNQWRDLMTPRTDRLSTYPTRPDPTQPAPTPAAAPEGLFDPTPYTLTKGLR